MGRLFSRTINRDDTFSGADKFTHSARCSSEGGAGGGGGGGGTTRRQINKNPHYLFRFSIAPPLARLARDEFKESHHLKYGYISYRRRVFFLLFSAASRGGGGGL